MHTQEQQTQSGYIICFTVDKRSPNKSSHCRFEPSSFLFIVGCSFKSYISFFHQYMITNLLQFVASFLDPTYGRNPHCVLITFLAGLGFRFCVFWHITIVRKLQLFYNQTQSFFKCFPLQDYKAGFETETIMFLQWFYIILFSNLRKDLHFLICFHSFILRFLFVLRGCQSLHSTGHQSYFFTIYLYIYIVF